VLDRVRPSVDALQASVAARRSPALATGGRPILPSAGATR
jgi:hypothetical protein